MDGSLSPGDEHHSAESVEFRSRYFGRRPTGIFVVQSCAIWVSLGLAVALATISRLQHGNAADHGDDGVSGSRSPDGLGPSVGCLAGLENRK